MFEPGNLRLSVAYGSNAAPTRLIDKGLTGQGAVLLPAIVRGWVAAFEARRTSYGSVPLTFVPQPGAITRTWLLGLPATMTGLLDRTEGRVSAGSEAADLAPAPDPSGRFAPPGTYRLGVVGDVEVAGGLLVRSAVAYLPGPRTRVQVVGGGWRTWPEHDQAAASAHVDAQGASAPAPAVGRPVLDGWPICRLLPQSDDG